MSEFAPSFHQEQSPVTNGMSLEAQKFETTKGKINLAEAHRITNPPEYDKYYSGVCDVIKPEDARAMADTLRGSRKDPNRKLMIGVMASRYSLNHDDGDDMPDRDEIAKAFTDDPDVMNTIHYADFYNFQDGRRPWGAGEAPDVLENLELCVKYGGEHLQAIQLDLTWPKSEEIKEFKRRHPNISIILQVGKFALDEVENDPQDVTDKLREYGDSIDYALLDLSLGKGRRMTELDIINLQKFLNMIQYELPDLGLAVAGGLGPNLESSDTLEQSIDQNYALRIIARDHPYISIDAQGGVKPADAPRGPTGHFNANTPADISMSNEYLRQTSAIVDEDKPGIDPDPGSHRPSYIAI
jgi:hypothetical protein